MGENNYVMENEPKKPKTHRSILLSPMVTIRQNHLSKKDVARIKRHLSARMSVISFIVAFATLFLAIGVFLYENISTGWTQTAVYGKGSLIGQLVMIVASVMTIILVLVARPHLHEPLGRAFARLATDTLLVAVSFLVCISVFSDAKAGFTVEGQGIAPALLIVGLMLLIQPGYWVDAIVIDLLFSFALMGTTAYCAAAFGMKLPSYYFMVAFLYPAACYLLDITFFYAETQNYCQRLISDRLYDSSNYDELTHCKNRTALSRYLSETEQEEDSSHLYLMLLFDVDNFKQYNDQFSHPAGDHCLRSVCEAVRKTFPSPNLDFFRYGGDEFLMMFEIVDPLEAKGIVAKLQDAIRNLEIAAPKGAPAKIVTVSIGAAIFPSLGTRSFEDDLQIVDKCLYQAKNEGKNQACFDGKIL